jgi:hypothetical protein
MGFEEGVDPVDGWSAPRQALVLFATRSVPRSVFRADSHDKAAETVGIAGVPTVLAKNFSNRSAEFLVREQTVRKTRPVSGANSRKKHGN